MRRMVEMMRDHGWSVVVYNRRGHMIVDGQREDRGQRMLIDRCAAQRHSAAANRTFIC